MLSVTTTGRPPFRAGMAVEALHHLVVGAVVRRDAGRVLHFRVKRAAQPPPGASATASFSPARTVRDAFT